MYHAANMIDIIVHIYIPYSVSPKLAIDWIPQWSENNIERVSLNLFESPQKINVYLIPYMAGTLRKSWSNLTEACRAFQTEKCWAKIRIMH